MVKTLWLVRKLGDFSSDLVGEDDVVILVQDAVLRFPYKKNWYACKEDVEGRGLKVSPDKLKSYEDIAELILTAQKVVVW
jgi:sulfur transfer complex TusBCD TusB component (DsrH family)